MTMSTLWDFTNQLSQIYFHTQVSNIESTSMGSSQQKATSKIESTPKMEGKTFVEKMLTSK